MNRDQEIARLANAIVPGHFRLGEPINRCTETYIDQTKVQLSEVVYFSERIATATAGWKIDVVLGWGTLSAQLARWTAFRLTQSRRSFVPAVFGHYRHQQMRITGEYSSMLSGMHVLIVGGVLATRSELRLLHKVCRLNDVHVSGAVYLWNRGGITTQDVPELSHILSFINIELPTMRPQACEQCLQAEPFTRVAALPDT